MPEKDPVQEMISLLKSDQSLKTMIGADVELRLPIWHCRTREAFLMHLSFALNAIKKRGTFKAYKEAQGAYVEQHNVAKQAKANMNLFTTPTSKGKKATKKGTEKASKEASGKNRSEKEKASQKTKEGAAPSNAPAPDLHEEYKAIYKKTILATETAKSKERCRCNQDVSVLRELVIFRCKVRMEQDSPGADGG
jgi:hypothetical protein